MRVKRFVAPTMSEAVQMVRAEFGPDAILLQTGKARRPGILGFFRPSWVVVTAGRDEVLNDVDLVQREQAVAAAKGVPGDAAAKGAGINKAKAKQKKNGKKASAAQGRSRPKSQGKKQTQTSSQGQAVRARAERQAVEVAKARETAGVAPTPCAAEQVAVKEQDVISAVTGAGAKRSGKGQPVVQPASRSSLLELATQHLVERLRQQDVAARYLDELGTLLYQRVRQGGEAPQQHLLHVLAEQFPQAPPWRLDVCPYVVPLVGPTGVGKTTTIAKLAATYALTLGHKVGLLTVDTYRVAAVEQLRTYADILSLPLVVVYTPQEVHAALERLSHCELILVDTAGRSPRAKAQMEELTAFLAEMGEIHPHLVFSATTRESDLMEVIASFSAHVPLEGLIATKLDETVSYGCLYNAVRQTGKPIAFITNGQSVPEDIVTTDSTRLASYLVGVEP